MISTNRNAAQIMKTRCLIVCVLCYETTKNCSRKTSLCQRLSAMGRSRNSLTLSILASISTFGRASTNLSLTRGSAKLAVPTCTADAPTERYSSTSRSEEHTSELHSRGHLVCRLLLEKKKKHRYLTQEWRNRTR